MKNLVATFLLTSSLSFLGGLSAIATGMAVDEHEYDSGSAPGRTSPSIGALAPAPLSITEAAAAGGGAAIPLVSPPRGASFTHPVSALGMDSSSSAFPGPTASSTSSTLPAPTSSVAAGSGGSLGFSSSGGLGSSPSRAFGYGTRLNPYPSSAAAAYAPGPSLTTAYALGANTWREGVTFPSATVVHAAPLGVVTNPYSSETDAIAAAAAF